MHDDLAMSPTDSPNGQFDCATAGVLESDPSTAPEGHHSTPSAELRRPEDPAAAALVASQEGRSLVADALSRET